MNTITPNVSVQTPTGPVKGVTVVTAGSGTGIFGVAPEPAEQQSVTAVLSKVNQQVRRLP